MVEHDEFESAAWFTLIIPGIRRDTVLRMAFWCFVDGNTPDYCRHIRSRPSLCRVGPVHVSSEIFPHGLTILHAEEHTFSFWIILCSLPSFHVFHLSGLANKISCDLRDPGEDTREQLSTSCQYVLLRRMRVCILTKTIVGQNRYSPPPNQCIYI